MEVTKDGEEIILPLEDVELKETQPKGAKISLNAILESNLGLTMKLNGRLGSQQLLLLVDSGSTHNLISNVLV